MKPPFAYYGGKMGMAEFITSLFPPHRVYVEPFAGSAAVLFAKSPAKHEILNDLDDGVYAFFAALRSDPQRLEYLCRLTPFSRTEFELALEPTDDVFERARRFWVRVNQSVAKHGGARTGFSTTTNRSQSGPATALSRLGRFAPAAERLAQVTVEHRDAVEVIERFARTADTVVYADPPYVLSTRVARAESRAGDYSHEFSEDDHRRLARALHATPAAVFLSGYPSELYDELYHGWYFIDRPVTASSSKASSRPSRIERVWSNRPLTLPPAAEAVVQRLFPEELAAA